MTSSTFVQDLLKNREFSKVVFDLFAEVDGVPLEQEVFISKMKSWTGVRISLCSQLSTYHFGCQVHPDRPITGDEQSRLDLVDLLEAITYVLCKEQPVTNETFHQVLSARGVASKLVNILSNGSGGSVEVDDLMSFIMSATINLDSKLSEEAETSLTKVFHEHLGKDKHDMDFEEFRRIVPCKKDFFVERIFSIFDKQKQGRVSLTEFVETVQKFSRDDDDAKIAFLFQVECSIMIWIYVEEINHSPPHPRCMTQTMTVF